LTSSTGNVERPFTSVSAKSVGRRRLRCQLDELTEARRRRTLIRSGAALLLHCNKITLLLLLCGCLVGCAGEHGDPAAARQALGAVEPGAWSQPLVLGPPPRRAAASLVWDPIDQQALLFGGTDPSGATYYNDLWTAGSLLTWSLTCLGPCAGSPSPRAYHAAAWDVTRRVMVIYGGADATANSPVQTQTWEWSRTAWQQRTPLHTPGPRAQATMAWDPVRGHVILFGGGKLLGLGDTWQWDGSDWTQIATAGPSPRMEARAITDGNNRVLLFGGEQLLAPAPYNDTWQWNGTAWTQLCTAAACAASAPPPRSGAAFAFDPIRNRAVVFGGGLNAAISDDSTYEWDGSAWAVTATGGPSIRFDPAAIWYPDDRRILLFGGANSYSLEDTWEYHGRGEPCTVASSCETVACVDGVCCEQAGCGTCQTCAGLGAAGQCSAVTNADDDTCTGISTCDATGACKLKNGQGCALAADCASGFCVNGLCCNRACDKSCEVCAPAGAVGTCVTAPARTVAAACGSFLCNGTSADCPTACNSNELCASGTWCDSASGTCSTLKPLAQACNLDGECQSLHCRDGVCCDSACAGPCHFCGSGTCTLPVGADPHGDCAGDRNCSGSCDATGACLFPGAEQACDTCKVCNQSGRCNQPPRDGDDAACGASIACAALSSECRSFTDLTSHRCAEVGLCAAPNDPSTCTQFTDALDGTPCSLGVCQRGACVAAPAKKVASPSGGCSFGGPPECRAGWLGLLLAAFMLRRTKRHRR
jgi:hypothetical protein